MADNGQLKSTNDAEKQSSAPWGRLVLLILCPLIVQLVAYTNTELDGSLTMLVREIVVDGFWTVAWGRAWAPVFFGTPMAWKIVGIFAAVELAFMKLLPGPIVEGPETINHNRPVYKANGFLSFVLSCVLFYVCSVNLGWFSPTIIHDHLIGIFGAVNASSLLFCLVLYLKGVYAPTTNDVLFRGSFIADYYWGVELYPTILGFQVKQFTNSRFGMMSWPLILCSYVAKQESVYGFVTDGMLVSVLLQLVYVGTFFYYEKGYFSTMDIQHDRAGFYLCWGCLLWVPCVYTVTGMFLVYHPYELGLGYSVLLFITGLLCFFQKTHANRQRLNVRESNGDYVIFGKKAAVIRAKYTSEKGEVKESILLVDGWWKVAAHSHYLGEIFGALCWSLPALFTHFMPYLYVIFVTILLAHRAKRDDIRCRAKYGKYWEAYKKKVPYMIFPGIY